MIIISLIGEQTIPNLLPILDQKPETAVLVYTARTKGEAERIKRAPSAHCAWEPLLVDPYDIQEIAQTLRGLVAQKGWQASDLLFNLTGGTKAMALAAYQVAQELGALFFYFQSEGRKSLAHYFVFHNGQTQLTTRREMPALITIDEYLCAYVGHYTIEGFSKEAGGLFEETIYRALQPVVDEVIAGVRPLGVLEIDQIARCDNQIAIIETKTGLHGIKKAIDQLNTASGQTYLGTYAAKIIISDQDWSERGDLKGLAEAQRIKVIELPSYHVPGQLSSDDTWKLQSEVCQALGKELAQP